MKKISSCIIYSIPMLFVEQAWLHQVCLSARPLKLGYIKCKFCANVNPKHVTNRSIGFVLLLGMYVIGVYCSGVYCSGVYCSGVYCTSVYCSGVYCSGVYCSGVLQWCVLQWCVLQCQCSDRVWPWWMINEEGVANAIRLDGEDQYQPEDIGVCSSYSFLAIPANTTPLRC